jgi:hypothetical protein
MWKSHPSGVFFILPWMAMKISHMDDLKSHLVQLTLHVCTLKLIMASSKSKKKVVNEKHFHFLIHQWIFFAE